MPATTNHPVFTAPSDPNVPIWRYMDFPKYVAMLESQALFFARADLLGDPFEGSISKANLALRPEVYKNATVPNDAWKQLSSFTERIRFWTFVNCWHINEHESAAMWRLYSATHHAIAIRGTYAALCASLPSEAFIGLVRYINYTTQWLPEGNSLWPFVHKRRSFEHERELRAVIQQFPVEGNKLDLSKTPSEVGRLIPVPLNNLVSEVVVAPTAPEWFRTLTVAVTKRYDFTFEVRQSQLDESPVF
jgi:hypothetical protein